MQHATKQPAVLLVHDYYQVPGGEDVVVANEKHLLETHGHAAALYARRNEEISRMGALEKIRSALGMFFSIRTYREVRRSIRENRISLVHVHNTLPLIGPAVYYAAFREGVPVVQTVHNFRLLCPNALFYRDGHICEDCTKKGLHCAGAKNIELRLEYLSEAAYDEAIRQCRYCILNYSENYSLHSSGVVFDILFRGVPIVGSRCGTLQMVEANELGKTVSSMADFAPERLLDEAVYDRYVRNIARYCQSQAQEREKLRDFLTRGAAE